MYGTVLLNKHYMVDEKRIGVDFRLFGGALGCGARGDQGIDGGDAGKRGFECRGY
jgi:hypothetical protein